MVDDTPVLLVNYDFPPSVSGVRRIVKFAKFLPEFGFRPVVVCARPYDALGRDDDAAAEVQAMGTEVHRTVSCDPHALRAWWRAKRRKGHDRPAASAQAASPLGKSLGSIIRWCLLPDDRVGWVPFGLFRAWRVLRATGARHIVTSSFPHSAHLIGLILKLLRPRTVWVADFRDGWTQNPYFASTPTALHRFVQTWLERLVVRRADHVIAVSEPIAQHFRKLRQDPHAVHVIANGFDPDDAAGLPVRKLEKWTLAYTGTLFMQRSPEAFFRGLDIFRRTYPDLAANFQAILMTRLDTPHAQLLVQLGLQQMVCNEGIGKHRDALTLQKSANALLILEPDGPGSEIMLTQKVFEYLAAGKPIIAMAPEGALSDLLRATGAGTRVAPEDSDALAHAIAAIMQGSPAAPASELPPALMPYHRRNITQQLANILHGSTPSNAVAVHTP